jgi:hypothetical protein
MESRNASGSWAGPDNGWTEGDKRTYTFDVVHDIPGLIQLKGGNSSFVDFLEAHFEGGRELSVIRALFCGLADSCPQTTITEMNPVITSHISLLWRGMLPRHSSESGR